MKIVTVKCADCGGEYGTNVPKAPCPICAKRNDELSRLREENVALRAIADAGCVYMDAELAYVCDHESHRLRRATLDAEIALFRALAGYKKVK